MTYKKVLEKLATEHAREWLCKLLRFEEVNYRWISDTAVRVELDKESDSVLWEVDFYIGMANTEPKDHRIIVGGTADDLLGICESVIWQLDGASHNREAIWMQNAKTREALGICHLKFID